MRNPYLWHAAVEDPSMFFGRTEELLELDTFLSGSQSVSIVGPRKIGKTSLIKHLIRAERSARSVSPTVPMLVYLDCEGSLGGSQEDFFREVAKLLAASLGSLGVEPEPSLTAAVETPSRLALEEGLRRLNQRSLRIVLVMDEFEQLARHSHFDVTFFNALRSLTARFDLAYVTASARPLIELTYSNQAEQIVSSPFFNIFAPLFLGLMAEHDARQLIRVPMEASGLTVTAALEDGILGLAGGHPFALQVACYHAWESPDDQAAIEDKTIRELDAHFQYDWRNLSEAERDALADPGDAARRASTDPATRVVLRDLTRKCLLVERDGTWTYPSRLVAQFVPERAAMPGRDQPSSEPAAVGADAGLALPPPRENVWNVLEAAVPEFLGGMVVALVLKLWPEPLRPEDLRLVIPVVGALLLGSLLARISARRRTHRDAARRAR